MFKNPKCRHCGRSWRPRLGVVASRAFCPRCSAERREIAARQLGLRPLRPEDFDGDYLLPRALRRRPLTAT
jgi:hypothetical protein